ncbi:MAG: DUF5995 family protein [Pyrinomonadaceae bacterium]
MPNSVSKRFLILAAASVAIFVSSCRNGVDSNRNIDVRPPDPKEYKSCGSSGQKLPYDAYFKEDEFSRRLALAGEVSSVLEELEKANDRFKKEGDLVEIFPALLYFETKDAFELGLKPEIKHKIEYMSLLLRLYDSYAVNRKAFEDGDMMGIDRQWRDYYKAVSKAQEETGKWKANDGVDVLLEGVNAHIIYDLPRAIRSVYKDSKSNRDEMKADFDAGSGIYADAEQALKAEVLLHFPNGEDREYAEKFYGNGSEYVIFTRSKAWEMGIGDGPLGVIEEQPTLKHDSTSRKFFPPALVKRGICVFPNVENKE